MECKTGVLLELALDGSAVSMGKCIHCLAYLIPHLLVCHYGICIVFVGSSMNIRMLWRRRKRVLVPTEEVAL